MPKNKKSNEERNNFSENSITEQDIDPITTDTEVTDSLRHELKAAINTMGPDTPSNLYNTSENEGLVDLPPYMLQYIDPETLVIKNSSNGSDIQELYRKDIKAEVSDSVTSENVDVERVTKEVCVPMIPDTSEAENSSYPLPDKQEVEIKNTVYSHCRCSSYEPPLIRIGGNPVTKTNGRASRFDQHCIAKWFKNCSVFSRNSKETDEDRKQMDFYSMCVSRPEDDHSPPRRVIFNLVDEMPKPKCATVGVNTKQSRCECLQTKEIKDYKNNQVKGVYEDEENVKQCVTLNRRNETLQRKIRGCQCGIPARVDVYYFDHGNASYLRTTDNLPLIRTEIVADQSEEYNTRFWGEIFGTLHIGTSFITTFILQLFRFLLQGILRPLTIGILQIGSDYFFKPFLATIFNAIIQPPLICIFNMCTSLRDICDPIAEGIGYFIREIAHLLKSCRLVEFKNGKSCDASRMQNNYDCTYDRTCETNPPINRCKDTSKPYVKSRVHNNFPTCHETRGENHEKHGEINQVQNNCKASKRSQFCEGGAVQNNSSKRREVLQK